MLGSRVGLWVLAAVCFLSSVSQSAEVPAIPAKERIVVLVTVDGFPYWIWKDPSLSMPTLRKIAAEGAVGSMQPINPSITWPNHTTLVTGTNSSKHGVMYNGLLTRGAPGKPSKFEQWADKKAMVRIPTVYDAAFKAGLTTAHVDWPASQNSGTFSWEFTELSDPKGVLENEMVAAGAMTRTDLDELRKRNIVFRDEIWTRAGEFLIAKHQPNFLLFHLLTTDSLNHKYGPGTISSFTAYAFTDTCLKRLIGALEAAGYKDKYTLIVTTDHGFKTATKLIRSDAVLRKENYMHREGPVVKTCDVFSKSYGGSTFLYITDPAKKAELTPKLKELFGKIEGVEKVYDPTEYAAIGLGQPTDNEQVGDLFVTGKPGYAFTDAFTEGDIVVEQKAEPNSYAGHHGYYNGDPELNGTFIAYGYGIKKGVTLEDFSNLQVAPTIAKLLGVALPDADGKPLENALDLK